MSKVEALNKLLEADADFKVQQKLVASSGLGWTNDTRDASSFAKEDDAKRVSDRMTDQGHKTQVIKLGVYYYVELISGK